MKNNQKKRGILPRIGPKLFFQSLKKGCLFSATVKENLSKYGWDNWVITFLPISVITLGLTNIVVKENKNKKDIIITKSTFGNFLFLKRF